MDRSKGRGRDENGCIVRRMREQDLDAVAAIESECFSAPWTRQGFADALEFAENLFLAAEDIKSGAVIGYCGLYRAADEGEITNVAVTKSCRGRGAASALLEALLEEAACRGTAQIFLEVRVSNTAAIALYEKYGFEVCGKRRDFYSDPDEDAYVMVRRLDGVLTE